MIEKIEKLKANLAAARSQANRLREQVEETAVTVDIEILKLRSKWEEETVEIRKLTEAAITLQKRTEEELRSALIDHYEETGEKTYDKELSVRETTSFEYSMSDAVSWALTNAPVLLNSVDKRLFELVAVELGINFVRKVPNLSAVIAKKLTINQELSKEKTA